jgi:F-type H+-transporting ATPase subunit delta
MATTTHNSPLAVTYARSLLELAQERKNAVELGDELSSLYEVLLENPTFKAFLNDPGIGHEERTRVIDKVLKPQVNPLVANFLGVLNVHGRLGILGDIAQAYNDLLDEMLGKVEVDVTVSQRLSAEDLEQVRQKVSAALQKDAVVHQYVDESIIGGMILRVGDQLIDASVKSQLESMKRQLLAARPR